MMSGHTPVWASYYCTSSSEVVPYDFKELVEKAGLAYVIFNRQEFKEDIDEQKRFYKYVETTVYRSVVRVTSNRDRYSTGC